MTITNQTITSLTTSLFTDTANTNTVVAIKASSASFSYIEADNTANGAMTYLRLWNAGTGAVTNGTTAPDMIIPIPASTKITLPLPTAISFGTALSCCSSTTAGTAGTSGPGTAITVKIAYT